MSNPQQQQQQEQPQPQQQQQQQQQQEQRIESTTNTTTSNNNNNWQEDPNGRILDELFFDSVQEQQNLLSEEDNDDAAEGAQQQADTLDILQQQQQQQQQQPVPFENSGDDDDDDDDDFQDLEQHNMDTDRDDGNEMINFLQQYTDLVHGNVEQTSNNYDATMNDDDGDDDDDDDDDDNNNNTIDDELPPSNAYSYLPGSLHPLSTTTATTASTTTMEDSISSSSRTLMMDYNNTNTNTNTNIDRSTITGSLSHSYKKNNNNTTIKLPILELDGVILFPNMKIPIRLNHIGMVRYLGKQIDQCRRSPQLYPNVKLGIITYSQSDHAKYYMQRRNQLNQPRRSSSSSNNVDEIKHPLIHRIGTIATITYTGEGNTNDDISNHDELWRRHEIDNELVVTAIGTSRFRVISKITENDYENDESEDTFVFHVKEIIDEPFQLPSSSNMIRCSLSSPYITKRTTTTTTIASSSSSSLASSSTNDDNNKDDEGKEDDITTNNSLYLQRHDQLIWNLSMITPIPYIAYQYIWPWKLMGKLIVALETAQQKQQSSNQRYFHIPSLSEIRRICSISNTSNNNNNNNNRNNDNNNKSTSSLSSSLSLLEPTKFSYWIASNLPFTSEERLELLEMYSTVERLRFSYKKVLEFINTECYIFCKHCDTKLCNVSNVFTVKGSDGTTSNHVNSHGYIHQITTLRKVTKTTIYYEGLPETHNSYFPGYSWTITRCRRCRSLLGWKFRRVEERRRRKQRQRRKQNQVESDDDDDDPDKFFGFMSSNVKSHS